MSMGERDHPIPPIAARPTGRAIGVHQPLLGLLLVTHPIPSALYVVAVALFSFLAAAAAHRAVDPWLLARVLAGVACAQVAIGTLNDYRDRALDAASKPAKPLVRGL